MRKRRRQTKPRGVAQPRGRSNNFNNKHPLRSETRTARTSSMTCSSLFAMPRNGRGLAGRNIAAGQKSPMADNEQPVLSDAQQADLDRFKV